MSPVHAIYIRETAHSESPFPVADFTVADFTVADFPVPGLTRHHRGNWPLALDLFEEGLISADAVRAIRDRLVELGQDGDELSTAAQSGVDRRFLSQRTVEQLRPDRCSMAATETLSVSDHPSFLVRMSDRTRTSLKSQRKRISMPRHERTRRSFIKSSLAVAGGAGPLMTGPRVSGSLPAQPHREDRPLMAYVGTFSSPLQDVLPTQVDLPPGNGRGIHIFRVDRNTGALTTAGEVRMGTSPSHVAINAAGTRLYSSNETDRFDGKKEGSVSAFAIDGRTGQLELLNTVRSGGYGPTYVSIHPSKRYVFVANYFGGSIAVIPILPDGRVGDPSDVQVDEGKIGPTRATNAPPGSFAFSGHDRTHAHMIQSDPSGRRVFHVDLGLDRIFIWNFDVETGKLTPGQQPSIALPPGDGPRHFYFHPNGKWLYSIQEEGSTIVLFDYDTARGRLTPRQTISTLPPDFAGSNFCSEILVSKDGRFVYAGNRLYDSVGIFSIDKNGELTRVGEEWTRGNYPRSFNFDPTGRFFYCCNQRCDNLATFRVDKPSGKLEFTGQYTPVGNPSCIEFLDLAKVG